MEYKIEVLLTPHRHDDPVNPYWWVVMGYSESGRSWFNTGLCGWAKTPDEAWKDALEQYRERYGKTQTEG